VRLEAKRKNQALSFLYECIRRALQRLCRILRFIWASYCGIASFQRFRSRNLFAGYEVKKTVGDRSDEVHDHHVLGAADLVYEDEKGDSERQRQIRPAQDIHPARIRSFLGGPGRPTQTGSLRRQKDIVGKERH
jgi:hypothetical protein